MNSGVVLLLALVGALVIACIPTALARITGNFQDEMEE